MKRRLAACLAVLTILLVAGGALLLLAKYRRQGGKSYSEGQHSEVRFTSSYRNVQPEVQYVGDETCWQCHPGQAETYRRHPMGRSFAPVFEAVPVERYDQAGLHPFERSGFQFQVERRGGRVFHKQIRRDAQGAAITAIEAEVQFAIGSGTHGRSYLIGRDGYLFQSPISWYSQKGIWDLTPGFHVLEYFERPAGPQCLFCHANHADAVEHTINRYRPPLFRGYAIGCERCHGPGELHVQSRERGDAIGEQDNTIVNPRHLPPALRDAVCEQCHLQGESRIVRRGRQLEDYRPGLPLSEFLAIFVRAPQFVANPRSGGHVEHMTASRCYRESAGKLACILCHDPHALPNPQQKVSYYRNRCLSCHEEASCGLSLAVRRQRNPLDNCIDCHMPRAASAIAHTALTDHRILRRPEAALAASESPRRWLAGEMPLLSFHRALAEARAGGASRDRGVALMKLSQDFPQLGKRASSEALPLLEAALEEAPDDVAAWEAKGYALWQLDRHKEGSAAFEMALTRAPERETTLMYAAVLAMQMERSEAAIAYWQRLVNVNPWLSSYRFQLAKLLAERRDWRSAADDCEAALRLNPDKEEVRTLLVAALLHTSNPQRARSVFEPLLRLHPFDQEVLRRWFAELERGSH